MFASSLGSRIRLRFFSAIAQRGFCFGSIRKESAEISAVRNDAFNSLVDTSLVPSTKLKIETSDTSEITPPYIPISSKKEITEERLQKIKSDIQESIDLLRKNPSDLKVPSQIGGLLQICRRVGLKTEAFTILDHAFSAGDKFEWIADVVNAAVAFLCDEGKVMEAVTFLRSRELRHIKGLAFEPIIIALILSVKNTELMQIRMFAENIAIRLTARSHEAIMRKYAHEGKDEPAERALLLMHTQGKVEILSSELVQSTFQGVYPAGWDTVVMNTESDGTVDTLVVCPRCGMKVLASKEYPCMQFERKFNRRMWHIPFCENPQDENQEVTWACCVPPNTVTSFT